jgi:hypothetical protein
VLSDGAFDGNGRSLLIQKPWKWSSQNSIQLSIPRSKDRVLKTATKELEVGSQKLPYSEEVLFLAVHAAARLHNWIMDSNSLSYSELESPEGLFHSHY